MANTTKELQIREAKPIVSKNKAVLEQAWATLLTPFASGHKVEFSLMQRSNPPFLSLALAQSAIRSSLTLASLVEGQLYPVFSPPVKSLLLFLRIVTISKSINSLAVEL